jgi:hypothetical protein
MVGRYDIFDAHHEKVFCVWMLQDTDKVTIICSTDLRTGCWQENWNACTMEDKLKDFGKRKSGQRKYMSFTSCHREEVCFNSSRDWEVEQEKKYDKWRSHGFDLDQVVSPWGHVMAIDQCFSEDEVWGIIQSMPPDKAPGPDGFIECFYQTAWPIIKRDIMQALGGALVAWCSKPLPP